MTTKLEICQAALDQIGAKPIASIDEDTAEARACRRQYTISLRHLLREHPWNFASKVALLAEVTPDTNYGFDYAYAYPPDCLLARHIYRAVNTTAPIAFAVRFDDSVNSKVILTSEAQAVLEYTKNIDNPAFFDASFVHTLARRLALDLSIPLTRSTKIYDVAAQIYQYSLRTSIQADCAEGHSIPENHFTTFEQARL